MPFHKSHAKYVLDQFDAGVSSDQILLDLRYRDFLPSVNIGTIERCIRDSGRILPDHQTDDATQGNQTLEVGQSSSSIPPASQGSPDSTMATQGSVQSPLESTPDTSREFGPHTTTETLQESGLSTVSFTTETSPTTDEQFDDSEWDAEADAYVLAAFVAKKSGEEMWRTLRRAGYNITSQDIVDSMVRQSLNIKGV